MLTLSVCSECYLIVLKQLQLLVLFTLHMSVNFSLVLTYKTTVQM